MQNKFTIWAASLLACASLFTQQANAQIVSGNVFIKGNFVELGLSPIGAFGTTVFAPAGYHPRSGGGGDYLGFVADPDADGWAVGTPNYIGDYFYPGSPQEGWDVQIGAQWNQAWRQNGGTTFSTGAGALTLTGANFSLDTIFSKKISVWKGSMGNLQITQKTVLDTTKLYFVVEVGLKNTGATPLSNIFYERTVDPDNEEPLTFDFTTTQLIEFQPTVTPVISNKALVSAKGLIYPTKSYLGLGAVDCRAKAYFITSNSLVPTTPIANIFPGTIASYPTAVGSTITQDAGIGLIFNIGTILPGDSTSIAYAYILREADLDSAFAVLQGNWSINGQNFQSEDTLEICKGKTIPLNVEGGGAYVWGDWTPTAGLSNTSGRYNTLTVQNGITTYRIIGVNPICPESDTLYITIKGLGDTTVYNPSICQGETYDFNGQLKFTTGTYYQTYSTSAEGCDSVVRVNLTVKPIASTDIQASQTTLCVGDQALFFVNGPTQGATYTWLRNDVPIPGANGDSYTADALAGVYRVVAVADNGCPDTSRGITITVNPAATVDITTVQVGDICIGDTMKFDVNPLGGYSYIWSPDSYFRNVSGARYPSVKGIIPETSYVAVTATNQYGCKAYDSIKVVAKPCCEVAFPTAFSPNGDGLNDYFMPMMQRGQKLVTFQVFNRRGNLVYNNNNAIKGWNGMDIESGDACAQSVYYYRIVYTCTDGTNYEEKGDITLVR